MRVPFSSLLIFASICHGEVLEGEAGRSADDLPVRTFTLKHPSGMSAVVSDLGATLRQLTVPDRAGKLANITVGYDSDEGWLDNRSFFGVSVGRYANRIAEGKFTLDGVEYELAVNNGPNHLHGGLKGFDKAVWKSEVVSPTQVRFSHLSPDGDEGYPGNLKVTVTYEIGEDSLSWKAEATTDRATPVNLTNHAYFNLSEKSTESVLSHRLLIHADKYLPVDENLIPQGEPEPVEGTAFNFKESVSIGENLAKMKGGFDHNYVLNDPGKLRVVARVEEPTSGRILELSTNQPGVQFYLASPFGNKHSAFCLEPQKFPDSPNRTDFPDCILEPGETYSHTIVFRFPSP